jgi:hypothetical protein
MIRNDAGESGFIADTGGAQSDIFSARIELNAQLG